MRKAIIALSGLALLAAGCDPEAPVQSSDVAAEIDGKIAVHAADSNTHGNLLVPAANVSGEFDGDQIEDGSIGIADLGSGSVGSDEIADQSIAIADMGAGSVGVLQLADGSVTNSKIGPGAVTTAELAAGSVLGGLMGIIADNTITTTDIADTTILAGDIAMNTITAAQIGTDAIGSDEIVADAVGAGEIVADAVGASELANNAVDTGAIVARAVDQTKLNSDFVGVRVDATGGAGANLNTVFTFTEPAGGAAVDITIVGACESTEAGSVVQLGDQNVECPDVGNNNAIDGTPVLFRLIFNATNENVSFSYDAGANNETVAWEIYSFTLSGPP